MKDCKKISATSLLMIIFFISLTLGLYARFKGLGKWCWTVDEFYLAESVKNIIKSGFPFFPNGSLYTRSLLLQYLAALMAQVGGLREGLLRLLPLFFNLLSFPAVYLILRRISGRRTVLIVLILFSLSLWEIEFARFFRMYTMLQCVFLYFLYFLLCEIDSPSRKNKTAMLLLCCVGIFIHEAIIFLLLALFLPQILNIINSRRLNLSYIIICFFLLIAAYFFIEYDFRHMTDPAPFLDGYERQSYSSLLVPDLSLFLNMLKSLPWAAAYMILTVLSIIMIAKTWKQSDISLLRKFILLMMFISGALHQFSLCFFFSLFFLFADEGSCKGFQSRIFQRIYQAIAVFLIFWAVFGLLLYGPEMSVIMAVKKTVIRLIRYPSFIENIVVAFWAVMPRFVLLFILSFGFAIYLRLKGHLKKEISALCTSLIFILIFLGTLRTSYVKTRYVFFLYPVVLMIMASVFSDAIEFYSLKKQWKSYAPFAFLILFFLISEDYRCEHLFCLDSLEYNFRKKYSLMVQEHYYPRNDYKTPAEFVDKNRQTDDIVILDSHPPVWYINDFDYFFSQIHTTNYETICAEKGQKEIWRLKPLIAMEQDLKSIIRRASGTVWFIQMRRRDRNYPHLLETFQEHTVYTSLCGRVRVIKLHSADMQ